jgi:hypothetical protein
MKFKCTNQIDTPEYLKKVIRNLSGSDPEKLKATRGLTPRWPLEKSILLCSYL